jgi:PhnB protein
MNLYAHLTFNGNCRQAMRFYQKCFGGKLSFQTIGESPQSDKLSARMKKCIVLATLTREGMLLLGSDLVSDAGLIKGNAVTLMLQCKNEVELKAIYRRLSAGIATNQSIQKTFWGMWLSGVTDKFGNHWLLS